MIDVDFAHSENLSFGPLNEVLVFQNAVFELISRAKKIADECFIVYPWRGLSLCA